MAKRARMPAATRAKTKPLTPERIDELLRRAAPRAAELDRKLKRLFEPTEEQLRFRLR